MKEAALFLIIFGSILMLVGISLCIRKDPRKSILLYKVQGLEKKDVKEAKKISIEIGSAVFGAGLAIVIIFCIELGRL